MKSALSRLIERHDIRFRFYVQLNQPQRILELGCGAGHNCNRLAAMYPSAEVHGVDLLNPQEVSESVVYSRVNLDAEPLPYPADYFDAVVFIHVIEHLQHPMQVAGEINRILKKGGLLYIEAPNWTSMLLPSFGIAREKHGPFNFFDDPTHIRPWTKHSLFEFVVQGCGLTAREIGTVRNWPRLPIDCVKAFVALFGGGRQQLMQAIWNITGWCIYGVGEKQ